jgi:RNA polymerase sigma-70 factor (ECF subfamily)
MQNMTDQDLMLHYQQGNGVAMEEILRRYRKPVCQYSYRICRNAAEAEDVAQDVFLRVHLCRATYVPRGKFSTWIFGIAHNLVVDRLRRRKWWAPWPKRDSDSDQDVEFKSPDPTPQDAAAGRERTELVQACIQELPFLQKEALVLREYHDMGYEDIADVLDVSLGMVKTLLHRARHALKEKLLPYIEEGKGASHE